MNIMDLFEQYNGLQREFKKEGYTDEEKLQIKGLMTQIDNEINNILSDPNREKVYFPFN